jgi:hypothetical protein
MSLVSLSGGEFGKSTGCNRAALVLVAFMLCTFLEYAQHYEKVLGDPTVPNVSAAG